MQATTYSHNVGYGSAASGAKRPVVDWDELATKGICGSGAQYANDGLALQLFLPASSESMGNHDSDIVDADGVG